VARDTGRGKEKTASETPFNIGSNVFLNQWDYICNPM
jgi:hypothetical protein